MTGSRCFVRDRIDRAEPIAPAIGQVIASAIGQATAVAIVPGIVAAIGRARRIVPKVVATAPKPAAEIAPRPEARVAGDRAKAANRGGSAARGER